QESVEESTMERSWVDAPFLSGPMPEDARQCGFASEMIRRVGSPPLRASDPNSSALRWSTIEAGISAAGCNGQPVQIMRPAPIMAGALRLVGKTAMDHAQ